MKKNITTTFIAVILISLTGCKSYWEYQKSKKSGEITTMQKAYDKFTAEIDSILSSKMSSYKSLNDFTSENNGYFKVTNINEEEAPYIVGSILSLKNKTVTSERLPSMLVDLKYLDTKIKFDRPEISVFINKSANINVEGLNIAKASMNAEDRMRIVYEKAFVAQPSELNWFNDSLWEKTITRYGLRKSDSLYVVKNVLVKKFTYSVYQATNGQFSATPTPVVAIDGKIFQESGGERNIYEVYIQLSKLRFPIDIAVNPIVTDTISVDSKFLQEIKIDEKSIFKFNKKE
jgi:hypothetical protein